MRKFLTVLLFSLFITAVYASDFDEIQFNDIPYVDMESVCKKLQFSPPEEKEKNKVQAKGPLGSLAFGLHSRECRINGYLHWLTLPFEKNEKGKYLISQMDLNKLILPILQPEISTPRNPALGVIIDAGHGGSNDGATARNGMREKNLNLDTARLLREILRKEGIPCVMTRDSDKYLSLEARARFTERYPAYIFVSVHYNEGRRISRGIETYCLSPHHAASTNDSRTGLTKKSRVEKGNKHDEANALLASLVHQEVAKLHPDEGDRGLKRARFVVLRQSCVPAVLVEGGFLSSKEDIAIIKTQEYRQFLAEKIADGIKKFMKIMNTVPEKISAPPAKEEKEFVEPSVELRDTDKTKPDLETEVSPSLEAEDAIAPEDGRDMEEKAQPELNSEEAIIKREMEIISNQTQNGAKPMEEKPTEEKPAEEKQADQQPAVETSTIETPAVESPVEMKPAEENVIKETH